MDARSFPQPATPDAPKSKALGVKSTVAAKLTW